MWLVRLRGRWQGILLGMLMAWGFCGGFSLRFVDDGMQRDGIFW